MSVSVVQLMEAGRLAPARPRRPRGSRAQWRAYHREQARRELSRRRRLLPVAVRLLQALRAMRPIQARLALAEGKVLAHLKEGRRFQELGQVRFADFVSEDLHQHPRTARRRIAVCRHIARFPELRRPFLAGEIGTSKIIALRSVLTRENAPFWAGVAARLSHRELVAQVQRARSRERDGGDGELDPRGGPSEDGLTDTDRRRIYFLSPRSAGYAIEHGLETARRVLGWDAPRDDCLGAILSEGVSSLKLPAPPDSSSELAALPDTPSDGIDASAEETVSPSEPLRSPRRRRHRPQVGYHRSELKRARRLVNKVDRMLQRTDRLLAQAENDNPADPPKTSAPTGLKTLSANQLVDRHRTMTRVKNPLRAYEARLVYFFFQLGIDILLQSEKSSEDQPEDRPAVCAAILGVSERTVYNLAGAGYVLENCSSLADAFIQGRIGLAHVFILKNPFDFHARDWIRRAQEVTLRHFRRERRLLHRLYEVIGRPVHAVFPIPRFEEALKRHLVKRGWTQADIESELASRDLVSPPDAPRDPAENPVAMARLETLIDIIAIDTWRPSGKTVSVSGRHLPVVVMAKVHIWDQWRAVLDQVREVCRTLPPWAVATLLVKTALDEWRRIDPGRIPTESNILERDDYRCRAPGCTSRKHLEVHHIVFRSHQGSNAPENLITLCHAHHHHAAHRGTLRISGRAPHDLTWEFGRPLHRRFRGEKRIHPPR